MSIALQFSLPLPVILTQLPRQASAAELEALYRPARPVHVWQLPYAMPEGLDPLTVLGAEELTQARCLQTAGPRLRYLAVHTAIRAVLAGYLGCEPQRIDYRYGAFGKPRLAEPAAARELAVNWAYAGRCAVLAIAVRDEVGITCAAPPPSPKADPMAVTRLAWLKANGQGFSCGRFRFPMADWFCSEFDLFNDQHAVVVASGAAGSVSLRRWSAPVASADDVALAVA